jgi:restriction system protein
MTVTGPVEGPSRKRPSRKRKRKRTRAPKGTLLSEEEYELPLLQILDARGGSAQTGDVLSELEAILDGKLTTADRERLASGGVRWRQRAQFVRLRLVEAGDMVSDSPRGVWEISDQGRDRVREAGGAD